MSPTLQHRLTRLAQPDTLPLLRVLQRGIEKESLRTTPDGELAQTPHPRALGSALTHPSITTDYSEALLELITPVATSIDASLQQLDQLHRYAYSVLDDEQLWHASMPCRLGREADIPVADYGSSNSGQLKRIYRVGLGHRYGRHMQTIAGIHYNFSLPEALWPTLLERADQGGVTDAYFATIRNFRRWAWLLVYLFGASPVLSRSFLTGDDGRERPHRLQQLDADTLYLPYATSLRMGDLGYQSNAQENLSICYNCVDNYIDTLKHAILDPYPDYRHIGIQVDGEYRQLSEGLLQIENEFYSPIRPKRVARRGETALTALAQRGVQYIEVRCLDLNPFLPLGIDADTLRFVDAFLLFCALSDSPLCNEAGRAELKANSRSVVNEGRRPGLQLQRDGAPIALRDWALEMLDEVGACADLLDRADGGEHHRAVVAAMRQRVEQPALTPSAQVLASLQASGLTFLQWMRQRSQQFADQFRANPPEASTQLALSAAAERSLLLQAELESAGEAPFDRYLAHYFEQYRAL